MLQQGSRSSDDPLHSHVFNSEPDLNSVLYIEPGIDYESMKQNFHVLILVLNDIHINKVSGICKSHFLTMSVNGQGHLKGSKVKYYDDRLLSSLEI